jgi:hypothetical protein
MANSENNTMIPDEVIMKKIFIKGIESDDGWVSGRTLRYEAYSIKGAGKKKFGEVPFAFYVSAIRERG